LNLRNLAFGFQDDRLQLPPKRPTFLRHSIGYKVWETPFEELRWPMLENLRMDPFERAYDDSMDYTHWATDRMYLLAPAGGYVAQWLQSSATFRRARNLAPSTSTA
jgi:hypothetical protein